MIWDQKVQAEGLFFLDYSQSDQPAIKLYYILACLEKLQALRAATLEAGWV